jgi:phospholipase/carboxylesterase
MSVDAYVHLRRDGEDGGPLVFLFHGTGGNERQMLGLGLEQVLGPGTTLIAPRGDVDENGAARYFRRKGEGLYDMADLARATTKMAGFVEAHVAAAPMRPTQVIGIGFSNGANILGSVVFARRDLFDAVVLMHPLIGWEPEPGPVATRVLITAGERDPICPPALTRQLAGWFEAQGGAVELHMHGGGHGIEPSEIAVARAFLGTGPVAAGATSG